MQKRSALSVWKAALAGVALITTVMALYVQLFERRSRQEEDRLFAARLERALAESRERLKAEILAELRAALAGEEPAEPQADEPLPNAVLRRSEPGGGSALQQVLDSPGSLPAVLARLEKGLDSLGRQVESSDRALRRDLEELRAGVQREQEVSGHALSLLLVAVISLVLHLLLSLWRPGDAGREERRAAGTEGSGNQGLR
jgi:hypothetical protein